MWLGILGSGQQAAYCSTFVARPTFEVTSVVAVSCPGQWPAGHHAAQHHRSTTTRCVRQGFTEAADMWPNQLHHHACSAAAATASAAATCQETQQQIFPSSSGMQSNFLRLQQQQVTQLLQTAAHTSSGFTTPRVQQQQQQLEHLRHVDQQHHDPGGVLHPYAVQTAVQQRCDNVHAGDGQEHDERQHLQAEFAWQQQLEVVQDAAQAAPPAQMQQGQEQQRRPRPQRHRQQQHLQDDWQQRLGSLTHPAQFTGWIKHSNSLYELQQLHKLHGNKLNPVNLSAMLVRLARLYVSSGLGSNYTLHDSSAGSTPQSVQRFALQLAEQLQQHLSTCETARQAANASWALAALGCSVPQCMLQDTTQQLVASDGQLLRASQPQELASLAWAFGKLQHDPCSNLWPHILAAVQQQQRHDSFKPQELAMLLWAFANRQQRQQERWRSGGTAVHQQQRQLDRQRDQRQPRQLLSIDDEVLQLQQERLSSNAAASTPASSAGLGQQRASSSPKSGLSGSTTIRQGVSAVQRGLQAVLPVLSATIQRQLQQGIQRYKAQELSMLLWSLAVLNYRELPLLQALANHLQQQVQQGRANTQDISNSFWALSKLQAEHPGLVAAAAEAADSWLSRCSVHELSLVLYGCACPLEASVAGEQQQHATQLWQDSMAELQLRLSAGHVLAAAEVATLLQTCVLLRQPKPKQCRPQRRFSSAESSSALGSQGSLSSMSSVSSMCSIEADEEPAAAAAANKLLTVLYDHMADHTEVAASLDCEHVACVLHALASVTTKHQRPPAAVVQAAQESARSLAAGMNQQQLCMEAWAAARLAPGGLTADEQTAALMDALQQAALGKLSGMQPQQLSTLAWAHARLWNLGDSLLLHELAKAAVKQLPRFGPQALSNLAWAFARARHYDGAFTAAIARRARALLLEFSPAELSNLVWGLVTLGYRQLGFLKTVAGHAAEQCSSWDAKACVKLAEAFAVEGMPVPRFRALFYALGDALEAKPATLASLTVHELVQLAVAFSVARVRHKGLMGHIAAAAVQQLDRMAAVDVVRLVCAMAVLNQRHDALLHAVSAWTAAELSWKSDIGSDAADAASTGDDQAPPGAEPSIESADTSSSLQSSSKLQPYQLPRLAWAYKTLRHEDACWYLAAAQHLASHQQQQQQPQRKSRSSLQCDASSVQHCSSSSSTSGTIGGRSSNGTPSRDTQAASSSRQLLPSKLDLKAVCKGTSSSGSGRIGDVDIVLQRPVYRPVSSETAGVDLVQIGQQGKQEQHEG